jgi:hypothetical protein
MPLSANFTDEQFEYIREICKLANTPGNQSSLVEKLDARNAAEVAACLRDIDKWKSVEYGDTETRGGIKGTIFSLGSERAQIRTKMRERLDYPALPESIDSDSLGVFSIGIPSSFGSSNQEEFQSDPSCEW